ncbi:12010_t:CDS:1 [Ambispora leptoticha]|uniref:12010_t:CDS:1 n=1 Tax=Ambispora leptoticha TaxID=144679 RepID=A0A9N9GS36_9GLOM|nr:12010_t:CDS:1 [Ambispora leptoticha]
MSSKNTIFISLVTLSLLVICFIFSHASPVTRDVGNQYSVYLQNLQCKIIFTQIDALTVQAEGQAFQGITDTNPDNYAIEIGPYHETFTELGVDIACPGTKPFKGSHSGDITLMNGQTLYVKHNEQIIDQGVVS